MKNHSNYVIPRIIGCIILATLLIFANRVYNRSGSNMIYIGDGFAYDAETKIVYVERYSGRYRTNIIYTEYRPDGINYIYDEDTEEMYPLKEDNDNENK